MNNTANITKAGEFYFLEWIPFDGLRLAMKSIKKQELVWRVRNNSKIITYLLSIYDKSKAEKEAKKVFGSHDANEYVKLEMKMKNNKNAIPTVEIN